MLRLPSFSQSLILVFLFTLNFVFVDTSHATPQIPGIDTTPPTVSLDATQCEDITDLYPIIGSVNDESPARYFLYYREWGSEQWAQFSSGDSPVTGELGER